MGQKWRSLRGHYHLFRSSPDLNFFMDGSAKAAKINIIKLHLRLPATTRGIAIFVAFLAQKAAFSVQIHVFYDTSALVQSKMSLMHREFHFKSNFKQRIAVQLKYRLIRHCDSAESRSATRRDRFDSSEIELCIGEMGYSVSCAGKGQVG